MIELVKEISSDRRKDFGPNLFTLLTVLFVGLKLTGHIDWSWWWVLSPVLIPLSIAACIVLGLWLIK